MMPKATTQTTTAPTNLWEGRALVPLIGLLCLIAYLPTLNNGFIADDGVRKYFEWKTARFPEVRYRKTLPHALPSPIS